MNKLKILYSFLAIALLGACANLDDPQPVNSISSEFAIGDKASALAALNGVYSDLQDGTLAFDGWLALAQYFSDEADFDGTFPTRLEFGNFNVFPSNTTMAAVFTDLYEIINRANNVITLVPLVDDATFVDEDRNNIVGQARFLRAQAYLQLTSYWNDVPLILTPTVEVGEVLNTPASLGSEVLNQVIDDFTFAESNVSASSTFSASADAASAFLARIALHQGNWSEALSKATSVLGDGFDLTSMPYLSDQVYSLSFSSTDGNSIPFYYGTATQGGRHSIAPSQAIIDAFEANDARADMTYAFDEPTGLYYGVKYPSFSAGSSGSSTDPIMFIRHSELVLIAAEASAELGDFDAASSFLNQVRTRAGLDNVTLDANNYVNMILAERFVEFAFEGGQRLLDLRRRGMAEQVLGPLGYDPCDHVWPLPVRDIDRNSNLTQNDCCNC